MNFKLLSSCILAVVLLSACSAKNIAYLENGDTSKKVTFSEPSFYDAKFKVKDLLTINVTCSQPEVAAPFNLTVTSSASQNMSVNYVTSQPVLQVYQVDNNGNINFPVLGMIHIEGLTKTEVENLVMKKLTSYIKDEHPTVVVKWAEYKYSVLGEVNRPGQYSSNSNKVSIFEALAQAGDMTIFGKRDNVKLIREDGKGERNTIELDLTNTEFLSSPYYYLEQNDIVYVEPNKVRARSSQVSTSTTAWLTVTSIIVSAASLLTAIIIN